MGDLRTLIDIDHPKLSIRRQCDLVGLNRSTYYYEPATESALNLELMSLIDKQYLKRPFYGYPKMTEYLRTLGYRVNRKRVYRLMQLMGLSAVTPRKSLSHRDKEHHVYPYLLRNVAIERVNQVWSADITYLPMNKGFMYLVAILDWFSRYVVSWEVSNSLDSRFCMEALERALGVDRPEIFNTDQGCQFTSKGFTDRLRDSGILISMDGRGRVFDNIFIERLWRTVKYEDIYLRDYATGVELISGLGRYFQFYNDERFHQSLGYRTPREVYFESLSPC